MTNDGEALFPQVVCYFVEMFPLYLYRVSFHGTAGSAERFEFTSQSFQIFLSVMEAIDNGNAAAFAAFLLQENMKCDEGGRWILFAGIRIGHCRSLSSRKEFMEVGK